MDYRKVFYEKSDDELLKLLSDHNQMNLEAKYSLVEIIQDRKIDADPSLMKELHNDINEEYEKVNRMEYVSYLGFRIDKENNKVIIRRSGQFKFANWIGVLIGLLLSFTLVSAITKWSQIITEGGGVVDVVIGVIFVVIGVFGLVLLLKCLSRIMKNWGFKIEKEGEIIVVYNLADSPSSKVISDSNALDLKVDHNEALISIEVDNNSLSLISSSASQMHRDTVKKIYELLV